MYFLSSGVKGLDSGLVSKLGATVRGKTFNILMSQIGGNAGSMLDSHKERTKQFPTV